MRGGVDLKKQLQQSMELGKKMKETAGMEWKGGDRCKRVGKKGAAAGVKEEKKGGRGGEEGRGVQCRRDNVYCQHSGAAATNTNVSIILRKSSIFF